MIFFPKCQVKFEKNVTFSSQYGKREKLLNLGVLFEQICWKARIIEMLLK